LTAGSDRKGDAKTESLEEISPIHSITSAALASNVRETPIGGCNRAAIAKPYHASRGRVREIPESSARSLPAGRAGRRIGAREARSCRVPRIVGREMLGIGERRRAFGRLLEAMQDRHQVDVGESELLADRWPLLATALSSTVTCSRTAGMTASIAARLGFPSAVPGAM